VHPNINTVKPPRSRVRFSVEELQQQYSCMAAWVP